MSKPPLVNCPLTYLDHYDAEVRFSANFAFTSEVEVLRSLRILGTEGVVESAHGGRVTRLVIGETDYGPLDISAPGIDYFESYLREIRSLGEMPLSLEEELSPTRWVIRAKQRLELEK